MNLIEIRHHLHQQPELSGKERDTSAFIAKKLSEIGVEVIKENIGGTGVIGVIEGKEKGPTLMFRCELDALPIQEKTPAISYKSKRKGISHKCGHDGHMAILLGLAQKLIQQKPKKGRVLLLFQPAEETGKGAKAVLDTSVLEDFSIDYVFALHNIPGYRLASVVGKKGSFTPSVESLVIYLNGKTSHAGMPEKAIKPTIAITKIIRLFDRVQQSDRKHPDFFIMAPIQINMGEEAYGTTAGSAKMGYTLRAFNPELFERKKEMLEEEIANIVKQTPGLTHRIEWKEAFQANINHPQAYDWIEQAAIENDLELIEREVGFTWGEDFGYYTQQYKGAMFGIGAGEDHPELHHPDYDFPDAIIEPGVNLFYSLTKLILQ